MMNLSRSSLVHLPAGIVAILVQLLISASCAGDRGGPAPAGASPPPEVAAADDDHGHDHGAEEGGSDLDRPLEELMQDRCEHAVLTYKCDECRYEVGFVKVAPDLLDEDGPLRTAVVMHRTGEEAVAHNGEIRLDEERAAYLGPRTPGIVRTIRVDLGSEVREGEILFTVESPEFGEARSAYLQAVASLELAASVLDRERDLYERRVCPLKDLREAEAAKDQAGAALQAARDRLLSCGLDREEIATMTADDRRPAVVPVRAPFDGTVLERDLRPGSRVEPGQRLLLLGDTSRMWVWTTLYDADLAAIHEAHRSGPVLAQVEVEAYPGRFFQGRVETLGGTVDEATRTGGARVVVENPHGLLRSGMFARVRFDIGGTSRLLTAPTDAVLEDEGRTFVFVPVAPPYFARRPVVTGRSGRDWIEIAYGLEEGDPVVSRGAFTLKSDVLRSKMGAGCAD